MSLVEMMRGKSGQTGGIGRMMKMEGIMLATVTNITDPDNLNRVKCRLISEENDEDTQESDWCPVMTPFGGASRGMFWMPNIDDVVVLGYLGGDMHRPFVLGACWTSACAAPYTVTDGKNIDYSFKTPSGAELHMYGEQGKEKVDLLTPTGAAVRMDDEAKSATVTDPDGKNSVVLDWNGGEVKLTADQKLTVVCGSAQITLETSGNITVKAGNALALEGVSVSVKASNDMAIEGVSAEVKASGQLTLQGGATADLKGGMVNIN